MKTFTNQEIRNYYDHTEPHYRQWWKMEESMGLHYGIWDDGTRSLAEAIYNTNIKLSRLGHIFPGERILDAGCGVGGSSVFLAKSFDCHVTGITLSERQVKTAREYAASQGVGDRVHFEVMDYTKTRFPDDYFDAVWAMESMQTAGDKSLFFKEINRILRPDGRLLIADVFKDGNWKINETPVMQTMLNGWAMSDIISMNDLKDLMKTYDFNLARLRNVTDEIMPSVKRYYWFALLGMIGTKWYNLFNNATHFSKVHYKTGIAQYRARKKELWSYLLVILEKDDLTMDRTQR